MIRCPTCGHLNRWSPIGIQPCHHCHMFLIMPSEEDARNKGIFEGIIQPYHWEVDQPEAILLFDGLDALMDTFQHTLSIVPDHIDPDVTNALIGSYTFAKLTRQKFWKVVPDLQDQVEKR